MCIISSKILEVGQSSDIGRKLLISLLFGFFGIGVIIEVFQIFGNFPDIIEKLKIRESGRANVSAQFFRKVFGILSGVLLILGFNHFRLLKIVSSLKTT
jgi:TctA family transporter